MRFEIGFRCLNSSLQNKLSFKATIITSSAKSKSLYFHWRFPPVQSRRDVVLWSAGGALCFINNAESGWGGSTAALLLTGRLVTLKEFVSWENNFVGIERLETQRKREKLKGRKRVDNGFELIRTALNTFWTSNFSDFNLISLFYRRDRACEALWLLQKASTALQWF